MQLNDRVKLMVPYTGIGEGLYNFGLVSEIVGNHLISVAPYSISKSCNGRVAVLSTYHNQFVDFGRREIVEKIQRPYAIF